MPSFYVILAGVIGLLSILYNYLKLPKSNQELLIQLLYKDGHPILIGHRAGGFEAPENTLVAIETAHKNGATAVEIDLDFTKDKVPVIFHDDNVDRCTNSTGALKSFSYDEVKTLNAAHNHRVIKVRDEPDREIDFEPIPTLEEAVKLCMKLGMTIVLDCKSDPDLTVKALQDILAEYPEAPKSVLVTAFNPVTVYKARLHCPEYESGLIWRPLLFSRTIGGAKRYSDVWTVYYDALDYVFEYLVHNWMHDFLGFGVFSVQKNAISTNYAAFWRQRGVRLMAWTVNLPAEKEYLQESKRIPIIADSILNSPECLEQQV